VLAVLKKRTANCIAKTRHGGIVRSRWRRGDLFTIRIAGVEKTAPVAGALTAIVGRRRRMPSGRAVSPCHLSGGVDPQSRVGRGGASTTIGHFQTTRKKCPCQLSSWQLSS